MPDARRASRQVRRAEARHKQPDRATRLPVGILVLVLLVAAGSVAYHNASRGTFVLDDMPAIAWNPSIRALSPLSTVLSPPPRSAAYGRPVVNLSLALNYAVGGLNVASYHLFNLAVHILSSLLLFAIIRRSLRSPALGSRHANSADGIATAAALLWVVHPLASESVDYTIQRTELLMGLFFLLTLYCAIRAFESPERRGWYVAALAAFFLGLGSKEVIVMAPAVVFVYGWLFFSTSLRDAFQRHWRLYAGYAAVILLYVLLVGTRLRRAFTFLRVITPWDYLKTQGGVILHYLRLAVWPHPLVADYDGWPVAKSLLPALPALLAVAGLLALTVWGLARRKPLAFLGVWFFAILAPTSSLKPIATEIAAERRMYLPLAAVVLLVVLAGRALLRYAGAPRAAAPVIVMAVAVILTVATVRRHEAYRTTLSFWNDVIAKRPDNPRAHISLGRYLYQNGRRADAIAPLARAVQLQPENGHAQFSYGLALASQGRIDEAVERYREAIRLEPGAVHAHYNLATALVRQGLTIEAIEHFETALRLQPDFESARRGLEDVRRRISE